MAKAAEDHFADRYGLPRPLNIGPRNAEFTFRTRLPRGRIVETSIDVKWTDYATGHLIHFIDSPTRSTYYVLVIGATVPDLRIVGWAWGKDLHASVRDLGHGPTFVLRQDELHRNVDMMMAPLGYLPARGGKA
jgi:hypothetical protein